jgi:hypothetical protein
MGKGVPTAPSMPAAPPNLPAPVPSSLFVANHHNIIQLFAKTMAIIIMIFNYYVFSTMALINHDIANY